MAMLSHVDDGQARKMAHRIVSDFDVVDIETVISDHLTSDEDDKLLAAVDPDYPKLQAEALEILERVGTSKQIDEDEFDRYTDIQHSLRVIARIAGFHLGFAAALRLLQNTNSLEVRS